MKKIIIYGASGHGKVIADIIEKSDKEISGFVDDDSKKWGLNFFRYKILGGYDYLNDIDRYQYEIIIGIGDNNTRKSISGKISKEEIKFSIVIHPSAQIAKNVIIEEGTVVMANAVINPDTRIGKHCILNTSSSVDHDCDLGDFVHISPGACLGGNIKVGKCSWIGLGASIKNNVIIGENSIIGAGAIVINDIPDNVIVVGNPAKILKTNNKNGY